MLLLRSEQPSKLILLSISAALLAFAAGCKSDYPASGKAASPDSKSAARQVKTVKVSETPIGETVTVNGNLAAYDHITVGMKVPGRLQTISVDFGSVVRKGQVIAQLEQQDYKLRVQQAEAAMAQARARLGLSPDGADDRVSAEETGTVRQAKAVLDDSKVKRDRDLTNGPGKLCLAMGIVGSMSGASLRAGPVVVRAGDIVPVTYINSSAAIKAFVGEHGGVVCTSSNAAATLKWAWERGERIVFKTSNSRRGWTGEHLCNGRHDLSRPLRAGRSGNLKFCRSPSRTLALQPSLQPFEPPAYRTLLPDVWQPDRAVSGARDYQASGF
jgi:hypothetical protein